MNIYIDFDRTLFDCDRFLRDFYALIKKYRIPKGIFKTCQNQLKKEGFNPVNILREVAKKREFDNNIYQDIDDLLNRVKDYIYTDTIPFLEYLKSLNYHVTILTKGNSEYQKKKILNSQIDNYYHNIIVTMNHKGNLDIDYPNSIFIDDSPFEIESLLKNNPKEIIRIKRKDSKYEDIIIDKDIKAVSSLSEIIEKELI